MHGFLQVCVTQSPGQTLFQKRAHDHADGVCSGLGCCDSIHSLIFVLCLAVDFPKVNTPLTMFLLPCAQPYSLIFIHFTISVMADNMAASNVKIGGQLLIDQSARAQLNIETKVKVETNTEQHNVTENSSIYTIQHQAVQILKSKLTDI